jgi:hypothetical protein
MKKMLLRRKPSHWVLGWLLAAGLPAAAQTSAPYFRADAEATRLAAAAPLAGQLRQYRAYTFDLASLRRSLAGAKLRTAGAPLTLLLPQPDGTTQRFAVWEAPLLAPALAAKNPTIRTYGGQGLDDPSARLSLTVSAAGLLAQILTDQPGGAVYLEAASKDDSQHIISYYAKDVLPVKASPGACGTTTLPDVPQPPPVRQSQGRGPNATGAKTNAITQPIGPTLTVYRLIVATTKEYSASVHSAANGTDSTDVLTNVTALVNNVRTIQERDLAVSMTLVNYKLYNNVVTGNYNQTSDQQMIQQNRINMETRFGAGAFDLAHLFASSSSGLAYVGVVANPATASPYLTTTPPTVPTTGPNRTYKAGAVSGNGGRSTPISYFSTSVIAHEMGHQFSATHTFNGGCGPNRSVASAWEPGSGSTIMSYADVGCGATIEPRSDAYYHAGSIDQIRSYVESITAAYTVGTTYSSGNTPPTISVPGNKTIPQGTPFRLAADGSDVNAADVLQYNWEELDTGSLANVTDPQVAGDNFPLFRSILPSTTGNTRYFPRLSYLGGTPTASTNASERLPTVGRALNFKCTVRDYHTGTGAAYNATASGIVGGVTESSLVTLTVSAANSTPFAVLAPNTGAKWVAGSTQTVTWNGVGTKTSAVNCQTVNIRLSTDGGLTYPTVLAANVPNVDGTGSVSIAVPANLNTTAARVMVEAADNYFFDISDTNFIITTGPVALNLTPASGPVGTVVTITGDNFGTSAADLSVTFASLTGTIAGTINSVSNGSIQATVPAAALTGAVVVTRTGTAAGTSTAGTFSVTPVVSSLSPSAGAEGSAVTISGTGLGNAIWVSFNGVRVQSRNFTSTSYTTQPNTITLNVPLGASTGPVVVATAGGPSNSTVVFTVTSFSFSPLALSPPSGTGAASEAANIVATLTATPNAPTAAATPLKVSSLQAGGRRAGTTTASGNTLVFDPTTNFRAGEVVQATLTTAATSGPAATALSRPYVSQFTTRARQATGVGTSVDYTAGVGVRPESIVAGNLNADPALDLVMVNRTDNTVSVMLNNGSGTGFVAAVGSPIAVGATPLHAVLADLDNDGNLDLVVTCSSGTINLLKGNGDGTFTAQASLTGQGFTTMTAVGDLNGDGNLDLVTSAGTNTLARALVSMANVNANGNGNFTFTTTQYNNLELGTQSVVLADFDEDGRLDLAAGNNTAGTVSVRFGDGAGAFAGSLSLAATGINQVVAADLTGDGHLDLASVNTFDATNGRPIQFWVGTGNGTFSAAARLAPSVFAYSLSTGDYNGDGLLDVIVPRAGSTAGGVDIFSYNAASAAFTGPITRTAQGNQPRNVAVADINNDQTLDFVTANSVGANSFSTALGTAGVALAATPALAARPTGELYVFPNPARGTATVQLGSGAATAPLQVLNALGQTVLSRPALAAGQAAQLPLAGLAPGLYVVRCGALLQRLVVE